MRKTAGVIVVLVCAWVCGATLAAEVVIGVVTDGPGPESAIVGRIRDELRNHAPRGIEVRFKQVAEFDAGWRRDSTFRALQNALDDPEVGIVLAVGSTVTFAAASPETTLTKPVVSTFVQRSDVLSLPVSSDGASAKPNLSFIVIPRRAAEDVTEFLKIVPFQTLHVAIGQDDLDLPGLHEGIARYERDLGIRIEHVAIPPDGGDLSGFAGAEAVYLTPLARLTEARRQQLIDGLNAMALPTFSMMGHPDVERGVLAGLTPDVDEQVVRRTALNLGRLLRDPATSPLPVLLAVDARLMFNARTAVTIGYAPTREIRVFAEILHPEALDPTAEALDLARVFALAEEGNRSLRVVDSGVSGTREDRLSARGFLLPQIVAGASAQRFDTDLIDPVDSTSLNLSLQQQIWDDGAWSAYKSSGKIVESVELDREAARLDVLADAGLAYFALAQAQAFFRIVTADLRLTENNLELAKLRRDVGFSGREEVLRWEAVLAQRRADYFRRAQDVELARIALNRVLGIDMTRRWIPAEPQIDPEVFPALDGGLDGVFDDTASLTRARAVLVDLALGNAPELHSLDSSFAAQDIQVNQLQRRYVLPRFFADASWTERLNSPDDPLFIGDNAYSVSVNAAYPVFEGGRRKHALARARYDAEAIERQHAVVAELVEQRLRNALYRCENSFPRIKLSLQGAAAADENLGLVRDQYSEGIVNVTDLLDAQNQKLTADQLASAAIYEFMSDFVDLQRALSWFEDRHTPEQRAAMAEQIRSAVQGE